MATTDRDFLRTLFDLQAIVTACELDLKAAKEDYKAAKERVAGHLANIGTHLEQTEPALPLFSEDRGFEIDWDAASPSSAVPPEETAPSTRAPKRSIKPKKPAKKPNVVSMSGRRKGARA